jgi:hypothetical protein
VTTIKIPATAIEKEVVTRTFMQSPPFASSAYTSSRQPTLYSLPYSPSLFSLSILPLYSPSLLPLSMLPLYSPSQFSGSPSSIPACFCVQSFQYIVKL